MRLLLVCIFGLLIFTTNAQLVINEVCSDNTSVISDGTGDFEDWIELYNASNSSINLEGYHLSDKEETPDKWTFPAIEIPAQGFLLIFASDKDFVGQYVHTNFKISKDGETILLSDPQLQIIDQVAIPALAEDESYGRQPDGSSAFNFLVQPSPLASNNGSDSYNLANPPVFQNTSYFDDQPMQVILQCDQADCEIYYTTDGNIPDETVQLYTGPINLDTTTVIRAISITPTLLASAPSTRTFFIDSPHGLPIFSFTTTPDLLWDWENGIFSMGPDAEQVWPYFGANFWKDIEIPMYVEYFQNEALEVEYPLGAKVHGGKGARTKPMLPLRLLAKSEFGTSVMDYPFFYNKNITQFERIVLRNASGDFHTAYMRDEFLSRYFIDQGLELDAIAEQPVVVYINGAYYGLMHLREKVDRFYLENNHGIDPDNIDLLEEDTFIIDGSFDIFNIHEAFVLENDLRDSENYSTAASYFDLENLADYVICQTYVNNTDWPGNNLKYWRARTDDAKWRYILFDMDVALGLFQWTEPTVNSFSTKMEQEASRMIPIFKSFLENENFRHYFINRYADLMNTTFETEAFQKEILRSQDEIADEMERHLPRWDKTFDRWYNEEISIILDYAAERPANAREFIRSYFELQSTDQISINTFPQNAGTIQLNTISLAAEQLPWKGYYYRDVPITISVQPQNGYVFSHWESSTSDHALGEDLSIRVHPFDLASYTAVFEHEEIEPTLQIQPNPASNLVQLQVELDEQMPISIRLVDASSREVMSIQRVSNTGMNHLELNIADLPTGIYFVQLVGDDFTRSEKLLIYE